MKKDLKKTLEEKFDFSLNFNQYLEIERLFFEIKRKENINTKKIINYLAKKTKFNKSQGKNKFFALKKNLLERRFPLTLAHSNLKKKEMFLAPLKKTPKNKWKVSKKFNPLSIFFEKETKNTYLVKKIQKKFPDSKIKEISSLNDYVKNNKLKPSDIKKPLLFIVKEKHDFLKPCPCSKGHISCGYWIFNLGFGCPFDCSYCYLQQYTNTPGIVLPANLEDFFRRFDKFHQKLKKPIRIGTGEFSDSLALDDLTNYSSQLINYFRGKKVFFELKTKSNKIKNIIKEKPSSNIIISWSLSPNTTIALEEKGSARLKERLAGAKKVQKAGFRVGFHFDPIIHRQGWEQEYKNLIQKLYSEVNPPFAWISLGTLRCNRELKSITEQRFPESNIFYDELFLGSDRKLRYPKFLRTAIYIKMVNWIRKFDPSSPVYLCMESKDVWDSVNSEIVSQKQNPLTCRF